MEIYPMILGTQGSIFQCSEKALTSPEINERIFTRSFTHMLPGPYTTLSNNGVSSREKTSPRGSTEPNHQTDFESKIHMESGQAGKPALSRHHA